MDGKQEETHRTRMPHRTILNVNLNLEFSVISDKKLGHSLNLI